MKQCPIWNADHNKMTENQATKQDKILILEKRKNLIRRDFIFRYLQFFLQLRNQRRTVQISDTNQREIRTRKWS